MRAASLIRPFAAVAALGTILAFHKDALHHPVTLSMGFFVGAAFLIVLMLSLAARGRRFTHLPVAAGRVVAIIPAYNEHPVTVAEVVASLLSGSVVPDVIHIVDDGSAVPVRSFEHPKVVWHRQANRGKRAAQLFGLRGSWDADFILTMDSDSVAHPRALEHALRAMSEPRVQAVTATCLVRNREQNLLTRLTDLEVVTGIFVMRRARSVMGVVAPSSGAFTLYRAGVLFDNARDYLTSGTYSDDRRLTHYALQRGHVVACDEAIVETEMPSRPRAMFRQRTRWFQGYYKYLGWELGNLQGVAFWLRVWNLVLAVMYPFLLAYALLVVPIVYGSVFWEAWLYWLALLYAQTLHYLADRPCLPLRSRFAAWLFLTPLLIPLQLAILRPAMYYAITKVRSEAWVTRDVKAGAAEARTPEPSPQA